MHENPSTVPHVSIMVEAITDYLAIPGNDDAVIIDCTLGAGGHAYELLQHSGPNVHLIGIDRDEHAHKIAAQRLRPFGDRFHPVHAPFAYLGEAVEPLASQLGPVRAIFWDLGVSSMQLDEGERGMSFLRSGPVDMRMDTSTGMTAAELIETSTVAELATILKTFGEEPAAMRIAEAIKEHSPYPTTVELADRIAQAMPAKLRQADRKRGRHPATRSFQALRIAVNGELDQIRISLTQSLELVHSPTSTRDQGGRLAVLTFHSLEDRIVKQFFKTESNTTCVCHPKIPVCVCVQEPSLQANKRALTPGPEEIERNPRARSAKLRTAERLAAHASDESSTRSTARTNDQA